MSRLRQKGYHWAVGCRFDEFLPERTECKSTDTGRYISFFEMMLSRVLEVEPESLDILENVL